MKRDPIIGWDLGRLKSFELPVDQPGELLLAAACPDLAEIVPAQKTVLRIWGFRPALRIVTTFYRRLRMGLDPSSSPHSPDVLVGGITAWPIVRSGNVLEPAKRLATPLPSSVFLAGGALDDGCELSTGMQGVDFEVTLALTGSSDHDLVATVQAMPNNALGCIDLADRIIANVIVEPVTPILFPGGGE